MYKRQTLYAPHQLGVDRWLAMLACQQVAPGPCLVIDCGTATTFDQVNADGVHEGGYILPGLDLMQQSIWQGTAIPKTDLCDLTPHLAQDTTAAIVQGSHHALASLAHHMFSTLPQNTTVFIGGGGGQALLPYLSIPYTYKPQMVIDGLVCLAQQTMS